MFQIARSRQRRSRIIDKQINFVLLIVSIGQSLGHSLAAKSSQPGAHKAAKFSQLGFPGAHGSAKSNQPGRQGQPDWANWGQIEPPDARRNPPGRTVDRPADGATASNCQDRQVVRTGIEQRSVTVQNHYACETTPTQPRRGRRRAAAALWLRRAPPSKLAPRDPYLNIFGRFQTFWTFRTFSNILVRFLEFLRCPG